MSTITPTLERSGDGSVIKVTWADMANGDDGSPFEWIQYADRSVHFSGTFGAGGTVKWQGSNISVADATFIDLTDPQGNAISKTAASIEQVTEVTQWARPKVSAGDGTTAITVTLIARRQNPMRT